MSELCEHEIYTPNAAQYDSVEKNPIHALGERHFKIT